MKYMLIAIVLVSAFAGCKKESAMDTVDGTPLIRTDFSNDDAWGKFVKEVSMSTFMGIKVPLIIVEDSQYADLSPEEIFATFPDREEYGCLLIADKMTLADSEMPILVINVDEYVEPFRVIPAQLWNVESNLSICNIDYQEFVESVDEDGVFRGFE